MSSETNQPVAGHVLITPATCDCDKLSDYPCPVCDGGLAICSVCNKGEVDLDGPCVSQPVAGEIYVASRASVPERGQMWRRFRDEGVRISSTWIDEDGAGQTENWDELWLRISNEIQASNALVLYAEKDDFPLKGALIEVGIALGLQRPVIVCLPGVALPSNFRPIGSWINHPLVTRVNDIAAAVKLATAAPAAPLSGEAATDPEIAEGQRLYGLTTQGRWQSRYANYIPPENTGETEELRHNAAWSSFAHNLWPRLVARIQEAERDRDLAIAH